MNLLLKLYINTKKSFIGTKDIQAHADEMIDQILDRLWQKRRSQACSRSALRQRTDHCLHHQRQHQRGLDPDQRWGPKSGHRDQRAGVAAGALSHVALTFGGDGAHLEIEDQHHGKSVPPVQVVNTVGAGDTFWVNTLADWALHPEGAADRVTASLTLVMKAAALNCTRQGCQPPSLAELENTGLEANAIKPLGALSTPRTWRSSPAR